MSYRYKREPLTQEEATRLAQACKNHAERLVVWTLRDTGLPMRYPRHRAVGPASLRLTRRPSSPTPAYSSGRRSTMRWAWPSERGTAPGSLTSILAEIPIVPVMCRDGSRLDASALFIIVNMYLFNYRLYVVYRTLRLIK